MLTTFLIALVAIAAEPVAVGVGRVDITPPPRLDTFGHGPNARTSAGHRGRLLCTAVAFVQKPAAPVALVACDLHSISTRLQQQAATIADLEPSQLILTGTHTHGGPAHYFTETSYTGLLSSDHAQASEAYLQVLARQIGGAVKMAVKDAAGHPEPASVAVARFKPEVSYGWNRSVDAYCSNPGLADPACNSDVRDPFAAVDSTVTVLRIFRGETPVASHVILPVHPTGIPNSSELFHADLHGSVREFLEARFPGDGPFGLANGAEGDVNPAIPSQSWAETHALATKIAVELAAMIPTMEPKELHTVAINYGRMALPSADFGGAKDDVDYDGALCPPEIGNAAAGGAELGKTWLTIFLNTFNEGVINARHKPGCQNPKRSAQRWIIPTSKSFPTQVPVHRLTLNEWVWATLPGEATTVAGHMIAAAASDDGTTDHVSVLGLAGGYVQYIGTAAEFVAQQYEGASTLFGRDEAARFVERTIDLRKNASTLHQCRGAEGVLVPAVEPCDKAPWDRLKFRRRAYPRGATGDDDAFAWLGLNDPLVPPAAAGAARLKRSLALAEQPPGTLRIGVVSRGCGASVEHRMRWIGHSGVAVPAVPRVRIVAPDGRVVASDLTSDVEVRLADPTPDEFRSVPDNNGAAARTAYWVASWSVPPSQTGTMVRFELLNSNGVADWTSDPFVAGKRDCSLPLDWSELPKAPTR